MSRVTQRQRRIWELMALRERIDTEIAALEQAVIAEVAALKLAQARMQEPLCGTESGYTRHRRKGEPTCAGCRRAKAEAERRRVAARAEKEAS